MTRLVALLGLAMGPTGVSACITAWPLQRPPPLPGDGPELLQEFRSAELVAKVRADGSNTSPGLIVEAVFKGRMKKGDSLPILRGPCSPWLDRGAWGFVMLRDTRQVTTDGLFLNVHEVAFLERRGLLRPIR